MAIVEGPFQNILSINTSSVSKQYFVAQVSGRISIYGSGETIQRQTTYTPLDDDGELRSSFSNFDGTIFALSVQFSDGSYGLVIFGDELQIYNVYNTGSDKVYMVGPCSSSNNDFICMIGNTATKISLYSVPSIISLSSTVDIFIPESEFSSAVGADYTATETIRATHVAPLPNGGFCYVFPLELKGENGTFGSGPYVYRGFVAVYFSALGAQGTTLYIKPPTFSFSTAAGGHTMIDGSGAIRKQASGDWDVFISASKVYVDQRLTLEYRINEYAQISELDAYGIFISSVSYGGGKYIGQIVDQGFGFSNDRYKFVVGDFKFGSVERVSSDILITSRFRNKKSFNQLQNPSKSNLVEFYNAREISGTAYIYIGNVAKDNLSDFQLSLSTPVGDFPEERVATASPGPTP